MKKLLLSSLLALCAIAATAQQYTASTISCTNNVPNNTTTTANLGSAIGATKYDEVAVQITYALNGAGTTACTFNFLTSVDGETYNTTAPHAITFVPAGATAVSTNLNITLGSKGYIKLGSIVAANNSAAMTNIVVKYAFKPKRNG